MLNEEKRKIFEAVINQDINRVKRFLELNKNKDCSFTDDEGNTLLHFASDKNSDKTLPIVKLLLDNGCDPHSTNSRFETSLDRAKMNNNIQLIAVLKHFLNMKKRKEENFS